MVKWTDGESSLSAARAPEVFGQRAAYSGFVEPLSGGGVAGDGVSECLGRRLFVALGGEHGAARLCGCRAPWPAVPEFDGRLHSGEEGVGPGGVPGLSAGGRGREILVDGTEQALGRLVEQGLRAVDQHEGFFGVFGKA